MARYADGTEAKVGDHVIGTTYSTGSELIAGRVLTIQTDAPNRYMTIAYTAIKQSPFEVADLPPFNWVERTDGSKTSFWVETAVASAGDMMRADLAFASHRPRKPATATTAD